MKLQAIAYVDERVDRLLRPAQIRNSHAALHEPRGAGDRDLVVQDAYGRPLPAQAARDPQPLIVATDYERADHSGCV
jgi:hypothetical protein